MYKEFDTSDDYFLELVRDPEKRAKALLSYKKIRKVYFNGFILFFFMAIIVQTAGALTADVLALPAGALIAGDKLLLVTGVTLFATSFIMLSISSYFENRVKLLLTIDEREKMAAEDKAV